MGRPQRLVAGNWQRRDFPGQSPDGKSAKHKVQGPAESRARMKKVLSRQMGLCSRKDRRGRTSWSLSPAQESLSKVAPLASSLEITAITPFQTCNHIYIYTCVLYAYLIYIYIYVNIYIYIIISFCKRIPKTALAATWEIQNASASEAPRRPPWEHASNGMDWFPHSFGTCVKVYHDVSMSGMLWSS